MSGRSEPIYLVGDSASTTCFLSSFLERAEASGERRAVTEGSRHVTYRELADRALTIAAALESRGFTAGQRIGLAMVRGIDSVAAILGTMLANCTYVALDPSYPAARLQYIAHDSELAVVLTDSNPVDVGRVVLVLEDLLSGEDRGRFDFRAAMALVGHHNANRICYVTYTSGSTGRPKGAALTHECLDNLITWQQFDSRVPDGSTAQYSPLSFDVSFLEIAATLAAGGELVIVPDAIRRNPWALWECILSNRIERMFLPYTALRSLAEVASSFPVEDSALSEIVSTGERLVCGPQIRKLFDRITNCRLVNEYGPAETHVVTSYALEGPVSGWLDCPPIGRPISNCEIVVIEGELIITGVPVGPGYIGVNADDPRFGTVAIGNQVRRAYYTGDTVDVRGETLSYVGRADEQLKISGYRVEPGEVEAALLSLAGVREAAVFGVDVVRTGSRRLDAAVVADGDVDVKVLRDCLAKVLPAQMVPKKIHRVAELPATPSGKIDRARLVAELEDRRERYRG